MRTKLDVPESIVAALMPIGEYFDLHMDGDDLIIENACDWSFEEMGKVADALGIKDIDLENDENGKVERDGSGCPSCGFGARLRVYGTRTKTAALSPHAEA